MKKIYFIFAFVVVAIFISICCTMAYIISPVERENSVFDSNEQVSLEHSFEQSKEDAVEAHKVLLKERYKEIWLSISKKTEFSPQDIESLKSVVDATAKQIMNDNQTKIFSICQTAPELKDALIASLVELDADIVGAQGKYEKVLNDITAVDGTATEEQKAELETYIDEIIDCALK